MFGFSRKEMRALGGAPPEVERPHSTMTTSSGLASPAKPPPVSPAVYPSELEGATQAAILEWQQAQAAATQHLSNPHLQTQNPSTSAPSKPYNGLASSNAEAPIVYPEPSQTPIRPTSTAPNSAPHSQPTSPPPMPTATQAQWLAHQYDSQSPEVVPHQEHGNSHAQNSSWQSSSPYQTPTQPSTSPPINQISGQHHQPDAPQNQFHPTPATSPHPTNTSQLSSPSVEHAHPVQQTTSHSASPVPSHYTARLQAQQNLNTSVTPIHQTFVNANGQHVIRPTTPAAAMYNVQQHQPLAQPNLSSGYNNVNGQGMMQQAQGAHSSHIPQPVQHQPHLSTTHSGGLQQQASHLPVASNVHGHPPQAISHIYHATPGHIPHPSHTPAPTQIPQPIATPQPGQMQHQVSQQSQTQAQHFNPVQPQAIPQQSLPNPLQSGQGQAQPGMQQPQFVQQPSQQPSKPSKWKLKPSKKPTPGHRPSISSMSIASSVSSVSTDTASASASGPVSPPSYTQVVQQPPVQLQQPPMQQQLPIQVQTHVQMVPQQPQQHVSAMAGHTVTYPWNCSGCRVGLSPQNIYYECLICSSADLHSKICQSCYTIGVNSNSLALGHSQTYYICNKDPIITNDVTVPPQKWTVKQNQFGRKWYQSCTQPVKTHIRPMTATIPNHSGWIEAKTKVGNQMKTFWVNAVTGESSWQRPPSGMPKGWREVRTPEGKPFYVHDTLELATWVYPGHQPQQQTQVAQNMGAAPSNPVAGVQAHAQAQAQVQAQTQPSRPQTVSPQVIHAPQPIRRPVNSAVNVSPQLNVQGQVQVNLANNPTPQQQVFQQQAIQQQFAQQQVPQQQALTPQQIAQQQAAKQELKTAGKQLGLAAAGGVMSAGLRMIGVTPQYANAMSSGVINAGKAGINVRRTSKPQIQQQQQQPGQARPQLQATYSSDGSQASQPLYTPQSPPAGIGAQQQINGQYFVNANGQAIPLQQQQQQPAQITNIQNIQQMQQVQQVQQIQDGQQQGTTLDINIGSLQIGDPSPSGNTVIVDNSNTIVNDTFIQDNAVAVDPSCITDATYVSQADVVTSPAAVYTAQDYVAVDSTYVAADSSTFASQDTFIDNSVSMDANYTTVDQSQYVVTDTSIDNSVSVDTTYASVDQSQYATTDVAVDTSVSVDTTTYASIDQSQYIATDVNGFASTATGPVPTDLSGYSMVDQSSVGVVDTSMTTVDMSQTSVSMTSVDASYAYSSMAQTGQENSLGLIDGTQYEDVTVTETDFTMSSDSYDLC